MHNTQADPGGISGEIGGNMKDTNINIKFNSDLKAQAQEQAKKEGRTLSNWIEYLVKREIEKASGK